MVSLCHVPHNPVENATVLDIGDAYFRLLKGYPLREWLLDQRDLGHSYRTIADHLSDATDGAVNVSYRTIARWLMVSPLPSTESVTS